MALLLDNDVVHKLAQLDLLTDAKVLLVNVYGELKVLNTFRFKFCHRNAAKRAKCDKKYNAIVTKRIEEFLDSDEVEEISTELLDPALIEAMDSVDGLDAGEMQLLQTLFNGKEQLLFTGDKRFLKALVDTGSLEAKLVEVEEKFVCFEQIIIFLIEQLSFEKVRSAYVNARNKEMEVDFALKICFSKREQAVEMEVIGSLSSYIDDLKKETANLLIHTLQLK